MHIHVIWILKINCYVFPTITISQGKYSIGEFKVHMYIENMFTIIVCGGLKTLRGYLDPWDGPLLLPWRDRVVCVTATESVWKIYTYNTLYNTARQRIRDKIHPATMTLTIFFTVCWFNQALILLRTLEVTVMDMTDIVKANFATFYYTK